MTDPGPPLPGPLVAVADPAPAGYAELRRRIRAEGLLDRRPRYYTIKITVVAVLLAAGWAAFFVLGDSWDQLLVAVYLAAVFGQTAFLGHEAGHRQIFRSRRRNELAGLVHGNLLIGLSFGWWTGKHNRHHAFPNQEGRDPDIAIGAVAFTTQQASKRRGLYRALARYQAYLFFPMLLLEAVSTSSSCGGAVSAGSGPAEARAGPLARPGPPPRPGPPARPRATSRNTSQRIAEYMYAHSHAAAASRASR
ncbi:MAG TPA: acyl-CoA desaturase [Streptosporangiaceae bacterium]